MRKDDPLTKNNTLYWLPLVTSLRNIVRDKLIDIFKLNPNKLNIRTEYNLSSNVLQLAKLSNYYLLGINGIYEMHNDLEITFLPFKPRLLEGHILAWRKNAIIQSAVKKLIQRTSDKINS